MPPIRLSAAAILLLATTCCAQDKQAGITIPDRMVFRVTPENKVDTKKAKPGNKVKMTMLEPEKLDDGTVIPAGAHLEGRVTETAPYSATAPAILVVVLEKVTWKNHSIALNSYIIGQGKLRLRDETLYNARCNDRVGTVMEQAACRYNQGNQEARTYVDAPVLEGVKIHQPTPQSHPQLVSDKHDIVIQPRMALLVRNMVDKK